MYNTIFTIKDKYGVEEPYDYSEAGVGQSTCSNVLKKFKNSTVILKGFLNTITTEFIKAQI